MKMDTLIRGIRSTAEVSTMAEQRRQSPAACTRDAIRLVTEQGSGVSATARRRGSKAQMWGRWKRAGAPNASAVLPGHGRRAAAPDA
jgi:transposase-like protein